MAEKFTVKFDPDNGDPLSSAAIDPGNKVQEPSVQKAGFKFMYWAEVVNGQPGGAFDFNSPIESNIELIAVWQREAVYYAVSFDVAGGSPEPKRQQVEEGSKAIMPKAPARSGYVFVGWYLNGQPFDFSAPIEKNTTLVAKWKPADVYYTVSFDTAGGSPEPEKQSVKKGSAAAEPQAPARNGYTFGGWYLNGQPYDFKTGVSNSITLAAQWQLDPAQCFTVRFQLDEETVNETLVPKNGYAQCPSSPKPGDQYSKNPELYFAGWYQEGGDYPFDFTGTPITTDLTLTARWDLP